MSKEIDHIRNQLKILYDDGAIKCERDYLEDLDKLAVEAGELFDRRDINRANLVLHKFWERAGRVLDMGKETGKLYWEIWRLIVRYRSFRYI
jgi:hypothetical protein